MTHKITLEQTEPLAYDIMVDEQYAGEMWHEGAGWCVEIDISDDKTEVGSGDTFTSRRAAEAWVHDRYAEYHEKYG